MVSVPRGLRWAILALVCVVPVLTGQAARGDLALEISADKSQYLMDEPLYVRVTVENRGDEIAPILRTFHPGENVVSFKIGAPLEPPHTYRPWVEYSVSVEGLSRSVVRLCPGQRFSAAIDLTLEMGAVKLVRGRREARKQTVLSRPGEYAIRARYTIPEGWPAGPVDVQSNELRIVVRQPEGADKLAYDVLRKGGATPERGPWNASADQRECYETILRKCPGSAYAPYARFYLALVYECDGMFEFRGLRGTAKGAARIRQAAALFRSVALEAADTAFGVKATRSAARAFARVGNLRRAQSLFEEAFALPGATHRDRLEVLSGLRHLQSGGYHSQSGLAPKRIVTRLRLPLRRFAEAMGLSANWDPETKSVAVTGPGVKAALKPGEYPMYINGGHRTDVTVRLANGRTLVSLSVVRALMEAVQGRDASQQS